MMGKYWIPVYSGINLTLSVAKKDKIVHRDYCRGNLTNWTKGGRISQMMQLDLFFVSGHLYQLMLKNNPITQYSDPSTSIIYCEYMAMHVTTRAVTFWCWTFLLERVKRYRDWTWKGSNSKVCKDIQVWFDAFGNFELADILKQLLITIQILRLQLLNNLSITSIHSYQFPI